MTAPLGSMAVPMMVPVPAVWAEAWMAIIARREKADIACFKISLPDASMLPKYHVRDQGEALVMTVQGGSGALGARTGRRDESRRPAATRTPRRNWRFTECGRSRIPSPWITTRQTGC